jgi:hypothetical protein
LSFSYCSSRFCSEALQGAFHDQRQRDPPDDLSGHVLDIDGKVAPIPIRHFVLHIHLEMTGRETVDAASARPPQSPLFLINGSNYRSDGSVATLSYLLNGYGLPWRKRMKQDVQGQAIR